MSKITLNTVFTGLSKLRDWWSIVKINFTGIQTGHNELEDRVDNIVAGAGDSNTEIVDARYSTAKVKDFTVLKDRLEEIETDASEHLSDYTQHTLDITNKKSKHHIISVLDFGAHSITEIGYETFDSAAAFQACVDFIRPTGGTITIPSGKYKIGTKISINLDLCITKDSGLGINIRGDNASDTILINTTATDFICNVEETFDGGNATECFFHMENVTISGTITNKGLRMHGISAQYIENVVFLGLFLGTTIEDVVRCRFVSCEWNGCQNGITGTNQVTISTPNAIEFYGCYMYGIGQQPAYFYGGCNINFFGGTIETNGYNRGGVNASGIHFVNCGRYGGVACNLYGVYFEGNTNIADVWITVNDYPGVYNISGCTFNKFAAPYENNNNIYGETAGTAGSTSFINVSSCSFTDHGNTPSTSTKYISCVGSSLFLEEFGNFYQSQLEMPSKITNRVYATGRFTNMSTTPALFNGYNISGIVKNATGDYTITFILPSANNGKITTVNCGQGFAVVDTETTTTVRIKTYNAAATAFDPSYLMIICTQA